MFRKMLMLILRLMLMILRLMLIYMGVLTGAAVLHMLLYVSVYKNDPYVWLSFYLASVANVLQISLLMLVTWPFAKMAKLHLFSSSYHNFGIGFLFSLISGGLITVIQEVNFSAKVDNIWVDFIIIPVIVFVGIVFMRYLLLKNP